MGRRQIGEDAAQVVPVRARRPRPRLPDHGRSEAPTEAGAWGLTYDGLVAELRRIDGLVEEPGGHASFRFRSRPFLHFHDGGAVADVRFGTGDFVPMWASTPAERAELLDLVQSHVTRIQRTRKARRGGRRR